MISNDVHLPTTLCNAQRMVLHAGTAANVAEDKDLDGRFGLIGAVMLGAALRHILRW